MTKSERKIVADTLAAIHRYWTEGNGHLSLHALITEDDRTIGDMVRISAWITGGSWAEEGDP